MCVCASMPVVANRSHSEARTQLSQQPLLKGSSAFETGTLTDCTTHTVCRAQATPTPLILPRPLLRSAGRLSDSSGRYNIFALFLFFLPLGQFCPLSLILNAQCALLGVDADADADANDDVNANAGSAVGNERRRRHAHAVCVIENCGSWSTFN